MTDIRCISTVGVTSGEQLSEALLQTVQEALHPVKPRRATEWLFQATLADLHTPWFDASFPRVAEGCWRMLLLFALEDLAEHTAPPLVISDLPRMLNSIHFLKGREEVLAVCNALQGAKRLFPDVFLSD